MQARPLRGRSQTQPPTRLGHTVPEADDAGRDIIARHSGGNTGIRRVVVRSSLAFLGLNGAGLGLWATVAPRSWFDGFPSGGHHWVALDGPYNHHLASDVGSLSLALAVITLAALATRSEAMVRAAGVAWLVSALPHLVYHVGHRRDLTSMDQVASLGGLALQVVLAVLCILAAPPSPAPPEGEPRPVVSTTALAEPDTTGMN